MSKFCPEDREATEEDLKQAMLHDPILHSWWQLYRSYRVTREGCLIGMILTLLDLKDDLLEKATEAYWRRLAPFSSPTPSVTREETES